MSRWSVVSLVALCGCYPFVWPENGEPGDPNAPTGSNFVESPTGLATDTSIFNGENCTACPDEDGDGYGLLSGQVVMPCSDMGLSFVECDYLSTWGQDCDDSNPAVHPYAVDDTCDGVDDNCDGSYDQDASGTFAEFALDVDGDGLPGGGSSVWACAAPQGYILGGYPWDCDDADPDVNPRAMEWYGDGIDTDCLSGGGNDYDDTVHLGSVDDLQFADSVFLMVDINGDGTDDVVTGNRYSSDFSYQGGRADVYLGPLSGLPAALPASSLTIQGERPLGNMFPVAASPAEDGTVTLVFNGYLTDPYYDHRQLWTWAGPDPTVAGALLSDAFAIWEGPNNEISESTPVVLVGAPMGPGGYTIGPSPMLVGMPGANSNGMVALIADPTVGGDPTSVPDRITGSAAHRQFGSAVRLGDLSGDGIDDVVATSAYGTYPTDGGEVSVYLGLPSGVVPESAYQGRRDGFPRAPYEGSLEVGDLDGDGYADVVVADSNDAYSTGAVYVFRGPVDGLADRGTADAIGLGSTYGDGFGGDLVLCGDFDDNGRADLAVKSAGAYSLFDGFQVAIDNQWSPFVVVEGGGYADFVSSGSVDGDAIPDVAYGSSLIFGEVRP